MKLILCLFSLSLFATQYLEVPRETPMVDINKSHFVRVNDTFHFTGKWGKSDIEISDGRCRVSSPISNKYWEEQTVEAGEIFQLQDRVKIPLADFAIIAGDQDIRPYSFVLECEDLGVRGYRVGDILDASDGAISILTKSE